MIFEFYTDSSAVLVFPSEITAASWAQRIAEGTGIVRHDRFISWDHFKELTFFGREERKPANTLFRNIFAYHLLQKNRKAPLLSVLVPPRYRNDIELYSPAIVAVLSRLISRTVQDTLQNMISASLFKDVKNICDSYRDFLDRHGRYEPADSGREYIPNGNSYCIFYPQLLEDFEEYRAELEKTEDITLIEGSKEQGSVLLYEFADYRQEFQRCLEAAGALLQSGVGPKNIAITLSDYSSLYPRLEYIARNLGIPLNRRRGKNLCEYSSVSWLKMLADMRDNFSFRNVRNFLLHPGLPWKYPETNRRLIARAIDFNLLEGGFSAWKNVELGRKSAGSAENRTGEVHGSAGLFDALRKITAARDADELYAAMYRFLGTYTQTDRWNTNDAAAWQRAVIHIEEIGRELAQFPDIQPDILNFTITQLESVTYLPQNTEGIAVYDYRVGAGLAVEHHFCINFNAESVAVNRKGLEFLREDILRQLFDSSSALTDNFITAYTASGRNVWISYSRHTRGRENLPILLFLTSDKIQEYHRGPSAGNIPDNSGDKLPENDADRRHHRRHHHHHHHLPNNRKEDILNLQKTNWRSISETISEQFIPPSISVNRLEAWLHCPFSYFWMQCKPETITLIPELWPFRRIGIALHTIMERIYRRIGEESGGYFRISLLERYGEISREVLDTAFADRSLLLGINKILHASLRDFFEDRIAGILEEDGKHHNNYRIHELEYRLEEELDPAARLSGRIDRIMQNPESGELSIIDYKTGSLPTASGILGKIGSLLSKELTEDALQEIRKIKNDAKNVQLSAYALLLKNAGQRVKSAAYYSASRGSTKIYHGVIDRNGEKAGRSSLPVTNPEVADILEQEILENLRDMRGQIDRGDFRIPPAGCPSCRHEALCRHAFSLRMGWE